MLEHLKKQIIEVSQKADTMGYCKKNSGNFSILDKESGNLVITPSGIDRFSLTLEDIPVLDLNGQIIEASKRGKPSSEYPMHIEAYKTRDDVTAVIHTHSHYATAFAILGKEIQPIIFEALNYGVKTKIAPYEMPGSDALAKSIIKPLAEADVVLMKSHGILVVGQDLNTVLLKASYVEDVAEIYTYCLQINQGKEPDVIAQTEFDWYSENMMHA